MKGLKLILMCRCLVVLMMVTVEGRQPVLHRVGGGRFGWKPDVNFSEWAIHEHFFVGDWLYFGFDKQQHNVLQVNKTSYDNCREESFIKNITRGGRDVFNLTEPKPYYFICGRGFCSQGIKVAIFVQEPPLPSSDASLPLNTASSKTPAAAKFTMLLLLLLYILYGHP